MLFYTSPSCVGVCEVSKPLKHLRSIKLHEYMCSVET